MLTLEKEKQREGRRFLPRLVDMAPLPAAPVFGTGAPTTPHRHARTATPIADVHAGTVAGATPAPTPHPRRPRRLRRRPPSARPRRMCKAPSPRPRRCGGIRSSGRPRHPARTARAAAEQQHRCVRLREGPQDRQRAPAGLRQQLGVHERGSPRGTWGSTPPRASPRMGGATTGFLLLRRAAHRRRLLQHDPLGRQRRAAGAGAVKNGVYIRNDGDTPGPQGQRGHRLARVSVSDNKAEHRRHGLGPDGGAPGTTPPRTRSTCRSTTAHRERGLPEHGRGPVGHVVLRQPDQRHLVRRRWQRVRPGSSAAVYGAVWVKDSCLTAAQRDTLRYWMADQCGVTLTTSQSGASAPAPTPRPAPAPAGGTGYPFGARTDLVAGELPLRHRADQLHAGADGCAREGLLRRLEGRPRGLRARVHALQRASMPA
jgi:hypothetical protein